MTSQKIDWNLVLHKSNQSLLLKSLVPKFDLRIARSSREHHCEFIQMKQFFFSSLVFSLIQIRNLNLFCSRAISRRNLADLQCEQLPRQGFSQNMTDRVIRHVFIYLFILLIQNLFNWFASKRQLIKYFMSTFPICFISNGIFAN